MSQLCVRERGGDVTVVCVRGRERGGGRGVTVVCEREGGGDVTIVCVRESAVGGV